MTATAAAADMILTAPTWTRGRGVAVKWEPLVWGCEQERQSASESRRQYVQGERGAWTEVKSERS